MFVDTQGLIIPSIATNEEPPRSVVSVNLCKKRWIFTLKTRIIHIQPSLLVSLKNKQSNQESCKKMKFQNITSLIYGMAVYLLSCLWNYNKIYPVIYIKPLTRSTALLRGEKLAWWNTYGDNTWWFDLYPFQWRSSTKYFERGAFLYKKHVFASIYSG